MHLKNDPELSREETRGYGKEGRKVLDEIYLFLILLVRRPTSPNTYLPPNI